MNLLKPRGLTVVCLLFMSLAGCANYPMKLTATNGTTTAVPVPRIETVNKITSIEVGEPVNGTACRTNILGIFVSGDNHLLLAPDHNLSNELEKTKAAAGFEALFSKVKDHPPVYHDPQRPFPNDILVAPTYHVKESFNWLEKQICVTVIAYRGRIKVFNDANTTTATPINNLQILNIQAINPAGLVKDKAEKPIESPK